MDIRFSMGDVLGWGVNSEIIECGVDDVGSA
jgi:hypothetical protein